MFSFVYYVHCCFIFCFGFLICYCFKLKEISSELFRSFVVICNLQLIWNLKYVSDGAVMLFLVLPIFIFFTMMIMLVFYLWFSGSKMKLGCGLCWSLSGIPTYKVRMWNYNSCLKEEIVIICFTFGNQCTIYVSSILDFLFVTLKFLHLV